MNVADPTKRFSDRVENYIKYRPSYPREVLSYLANKCKLTAGSAIADVGSGTGIFCALLLAQGYKVYAVEPNESMQEAAIRQFGSDENFVPIAGTAEGTTLPASFVDLIV